MLKKISILLYLAAALLTLSCSKEGTRPDDAFTSKRAILIYMAAQNNLAPEAATNLQLLTQGYVPKHDDDNILLVYKDIKGSKPELVRFSRDEYGEVTEELIETYKGHNSTNPEVLQLILDRTVTLFPCDSYGLILWSHSTGWLPERYYSKRPSGAAPMEEDPFADYVKSFGYDDRVKTEMDLREMADILPVKFDFIIFDCCLMGGIEVAYELRHKTNYVVAAPTEILADGFPYDKIFRYLYSHNTETALKSVCHEFFNRYNSQEGYMKSATISLFKTENIENLAYATSEIVNRHRDKFENGLKESEMQPYFRMKRHWFYDLGCMIRNLASDEEFEEFMIHLNHTVPLDLHTEEFLEVKLRDDRTYGISTYIPAFGNEELDEYYRTLDWNKDSHLVK